MVTAEVGLIAETTVSDWLQVSPARRRLSSGGGAAIADGEAAGSSSRLASPSTSAGNGVDLMQARASIPATSDHTE